MKSKRNLSILLIVAAFALLPHFSMAQAGPGGPGDPGPDPDHPSLPIPFDGGASILVASIIGLGARKAYLKKNRDKMISGQQDGQ